jgi:hypothetical protein
MFTARTLGAPSPMHARLSWVFAALLLFGAYPAAAQHVLAAGDSIYEMRLGDGSRSYGRIVELRDDQVVFETITGVRLEVNRAFARLQPARGRVVDGEFWAEDKHTTRLFFAPTGRTLRAGDGYAGLFVILPFVGYGATDNVTVAAGMPMMGSVGSVPVWVAPKVRIHNTPTSQISMGVFAIYLPGEEHYEWNAQLNTSQTRREPGSLVGIAYGVGSFGDLDRALHAGAGVTFGGDDTELPIMVGGEYRLSRRHKFISENWLLPVTGHAALSGGVRFIGDRWTTDLGLMALLGGMSDWDGETIPYFPIVSFSYSFGGRR